MHAAAVSAASLRSEISRTHEPRDERTATVACRRTHAAAAAPPRWSVDAIAALFDLPFNDLLFRAQQVHRAHHAPNAVQLSTLVSIKTGGCPEDCGYCPQAARYHTGVANDAMLDVAAVVAAARAAKESGASRFCMGAAWRGPKDRDLEPVLGDGAAKSRRWDWRPAPRSAC